MLRIAGFLLWGCLFSMLAASCRTTPTEPQAPEAQGKAMNTTSAEDWVLLPRPRQMEITGMFRLSQWGAPSFHGDVSAETRNELAQALEGFPLDREDGGSTSSAVPVRIAVDPAEVPHAQGYTITLSGPGSGDTPGLRVAAHDDDGLHYAALTLKQLAGQAQKNRAVPACRIVDWPDFPNRGVMLDVARDKVPEMKTLYELVDMLASWKYNQLQLYTEHSFAYKGHHVVWEDASPMTPAQVRDLDAYCRARRIQLVPNQNSFGHMDRWLRHPEYAHLAETPNGSDLCPVDPGSIELLRSMYTFMLPNFSSPYFNVGCDETWTLGKGRSAAAVEERGVGRVYLDFLLQIHQLVTSQGKTMMFWADIINNHPDLIPELPKDIVAMEWGYEAGHPYPEHTRRFAENGVRFYVVPGTSSWNSLLGRTDNSLANLREAALYGRDNGGEGYLVTDWGDGGHWQFLPVSYLPYAYGAAVSWCYDSNHDMDIVRATDVYAFQDEAGVMARAAYDLGNAYKQTGVEFGNNTTFYIVLQHFANRPLEGGGVERLKAEDLENTVRYIEECRARLDGAKMNRPDASLILDEFRMNAALAEFACRLGAARIRAGGVPPSQLSPEVRAELTAMLEPLLPEYRQLWLARNRSGGLKNSVGGFQNLLALLKG